MSMEEFSSGGDGMRVSRMGSSSSIERVRRGGQGLGGSPRKSVSVDSNLHSYGGHHRPHIPQAHPEPVQADTPVPQPQPAHPLSTHTHTVAMYDEGQQINPAPSSNLGSPSKRVAFKGVPLIDHETPRMLNGTPHHNPYPRPDPSQLAAMDDDLLQIETTASSRALVPARTIDPTTNEVVMYRGGQAVPQGALEGPSFPALTHHNTETAMVLAASRAAAVSQFGPPPVKVQSELTHLGDASTALPPIEYVPSQPVAIPRHISLPHEITKSILTPSIVAGGSRPVALPQIDGTKINGEFSDEDKRKQLGLEYQASPSGTNNSKVTTLAQAQGNVVKVAMYGEFPVSKAE